MRQYEERLIMNIVIVGMGKIGFALAQELAKEKHDIIAIDEKQDILTKATEEIDVSGICGSATNAEILSEAGIEKTDLLIAVTSNDEVNLLCCLLAKKMGASSTICRVRNPEYNRTIGYIKDELGLSMVVNPEREAAFEMLRIIENPFAENVESLMNGQVRLFSFSVEEHSILCGHSIQEVFSKTKSSALICAVERDSQVYIPFGNFEFQQGDTVTAITFAKSLPVFLKEMHMTNTHIKNVIIVGGGTTAFYLAHQLAENKANVKIIENDLKRAEYLSNALPKVEVINADGTDYAVLKEQGLESVDALCCLTGIDEENVMTSLFAKGFDSKIKTITKINRAELEKVVKPFELGSLVSLKQLSVNLILQYVRALQNSIGSNVITLYKLVSDKVEALEFKVSESSKLKGIPLELLKIKENVLIACINRGGKVIMPRGSDTLEAGDSVIIVTTTSGFDDLDDIGR